MTSNDQASDVATYAASVRGALSDLPSDQADVLLEDLEDHLREIAAEAGGPLAERLGPPEQYAQELRAAYGAAQAGSRRQEPALGDVRRVVTWVAKSAWYRELRAFLPQLRPAWWVLRGYLAALILTAAFSPGYTWDRFRIPQRNAGSPKSWRPGWRYGSRFVSVAAATTYPRGLGSWRPRLTC